jgi:hypothetical protein
MTDEEQRLDQRLDDLVHAGAHGQRRVERRHVVQVGGEPRLHLVHQLGRAAHRLDRVRAGELVDRDDDGGLAVQAAAPDVVLLAELHAPDVLEPHERAVGLGSHHDVLEVGEARQASLSPHGEGELLTRRARVAAELAGRVDCVLRLQRARDLVDGDVELRERVRVDPDADGVLRRAEDDRPGPTPGTRVIGSLMFTYP